MPFLFVATHVEHIFYVKKISATAGTMATGTVKKTLLGPPRHDNHDRNKRNKEKNNNQPSALGVTTYLLYTSEPIDRAEATRTKQHNTDERRWCFACCLAAETAS